MTSAPCAVNERTIAAFVAGELDEPAQSDTAVHLGTCAACRQRAADYVAVRGALRALGDGDVLRWHRFTSPFGTMYAAATELGLSKIAWTPPDAESFEERLAERFPGIPLVRDRDALESVERQIEEYFEGDRTEFDLPVDLRSVSGFDRRVLTVAAGVPYGEVIAYGEVARRMKSPGASRAVGNALGRNPVAIVVPCHRVVRGDGSLGGYGGGVEYKKRLLSLESQADLFGIRDR